MDFLYNGKFSKFPLEYGELFVSENADKDAYFNILKELTNSGYEVLQQNKNYGNFFSLLKKDKVVSVYFTPCDSTLRITVTETRCVPSKTVCENECETEIYFFENDQTLIDCGMCILIQCPDYSFFVIDSGHFFQINDNDRLHKFMRERTPENKKIVINGWLITHSHTDHVSKMLDFLKYNCDDVEIEAFYTNLLRDDYEMEAWESEERAFNLKVKNVIDFYKNHICHSGERINIRNLQFDVMYTLEDTYPQKITDFNDTSIVVMLECEGTKIFIPGDASLLASKTLEKRFGKKLKSDIVQISHHGHFGLSTKNYRDISAEIAVFPITRIKFEEELPRLEANRTAIRLAKEYYITSDGTVKITLPYGKNSVRQLPDETFEDFKKIKRLWGYDYTDEYKKELFELFLKNGGSLDNVSLPVKYDGTFLD